MTLLFQLSTVMDFSHDFSLHRINKFKKEVFFIFFFSAESIFFLFIYIKRDYSYNHPVIPLSPLLV